VTIGGSSHAKGEMPASRAADMNSPSHGTKQAPSCQTPFSCRRVWDGRARRMTAIFLSFQSQGWHTNDNGDLIDGATGAEAPAYDFSKGDGALSSPPPRAAQLTTAHRGPDGACSVVLTNMSHAPLDLAGWRLRIDARTTTALPSAALAPGQPTSIALPAGGLSDSGGVCMLVKTLPVGRAIAHRSHFRLRSTSSPSPSFAGCAPKSPMLGNAGLWGPSGPRALFREADSSRIP
jgi:hypothetical protein